MLTKLVYNVIENLDGDLAYVIDNVDFYYSKAKNKKIISLEFSQKQTIEAFNNFLNITKELWGIDDISFHDSHDVIIDYSEEIFNKVMNKTKEIAINEIENIKKR